MNNLTIINKEKIKLCFVMQKDSGVHYHRLQIPFANINENYDYFQISSTNGFTLEYDVIQFDVIVLNRHLFQDEDYLGRAKEHGVKIVLDLDDDITLPLWHGNYNTLINQSVTDRIVDAMDLSDSIWLASEYLMRKLAKEYPEYAHKMTYVPNAIDHEQPQFQPLDRKDRNSPYTIGWLGGSSHQLDLEKLYQPFERLLNNPKLKGKYNIMLGGFSTKSPEYWDYIERLFTTNGNLQPKNYLRVDAQDVYNYGYMYNLCDVMVAPLCDDEFSKCKSNIKILEAAAFSLPIICSNIAPYKEFIAKGLVYQGDIHSDRHIKSLIKDPRSGVKRGVSLHDYCREHYDINKINKIRVNKLNELIEINK